MIFCSLKTRRLIEITAVKLCQLLLFQKVMIRWPSSSLDNALNNFNGFDCWDLVKRFGIQEKIKITLDICSTSLLFIAKVFHYDELVSALNANAS